MSGKVAVRQALKSVFGYEEFRPHQEEIVGSVLDRRDGFVVMPTGGGKSLCFQLPAHLMPGTCVVISPLISLMKDQVDAAVATGLRAAYLNSTMTGFEQRTVVDRLGREDLDLLYVAPERFAANSFTDSLRDSKLNLFAIDEAHCISEWGHDFRPDYAELSQLVRDYPAVPVVAFTATATLQVQDDIVVRLGLRNPFRIRASFDRPNLFYAVTPKRVVEKQILDFVLQRPAEPGIVYRTTRKSVEETCECLVENGINALPYHAGMEDRDRAANQEAFRRDEVQAVVATIAFGMGIDKPNVRWIVHGDLPKNVESYYQETGRAGRDGDPAHCQLFFSAGDAARIQYFIRQTEDETERNRLYRLLDAMLGFAGSNSCRRRSLLRYFGEDYGRESCERCDVCRGEVETVDATIDAQKIMSAIVRSGQRYGAGHVVDIVSGAETEGMRRSGHDQLPTYGAGADKPKKHWRRVVDELICQQCVARSEDKFSTLSLAPKGWKVLRSEKPFKMVETAVRKSRSKTSDADLGPYDPELFRELRAWRLDRARELGVPPYVVFSDRTLREISAAKPGTTSELSALHGIGEQKLFRFGEQVIELVADYRALHPGAEAISFAHEEVRTLRPCRPKGGTYRLTWQMFEQGLSVEEIAEKRNLKPTTVVSHLEKGIEQGRAFDLSNMIDPQLRRRIDAIMDRVGDSQLKPVIEEGDGTFGYHEARIARAIRNLQRKSVQ